MCESLVRAHGPAAMGQVGVESERAALVGSKD